MREYKISFAEAREETIASTVFTTHTPVPAGNDYFDPKLMEHYFNQYYQELGLTQTEFLGLGRENPNNAAESFCMTILALKMSGHSNGVSKLHGKVSRKDVEECLARHSCKRHSNYFHHQWRTRTIVD